MHFVFQKKTKHQAMPVYGTKDDYLHVCSKNTDLYKTINIKKAKVIVR